MAIDILNQIKSAEAQADEIRQTAVLAANDALKAAAEEYERLESDMINKARRSSLDKVDKSKQAVYAKLNEQQPQRQLKYDELKKTAVKKLDIAADICIEGLLKAHGYIGDEKNSAYFPQG
ncbi:MAG: hypothetical protein WDA65_00130 [Christensenellales bacterium]